MNTLGGRDGKTVGINDHLRANATEHLENSTRIP